jgi:hypothetical protein
VHRPGSVHGRCGRTRRMSWSSSGYSSHRTVACLEAKVGASTPVVTWSRPCRSATASSSSSTSAGTRYWKRKGPIQCSHRTQTCGPSCSLKNGKHAWRLSTGIFG